MKTPRPAHRVRISFEPNRFSDDFLVGVYEQLKPSESYRSDKDKVPQVDKEQIKGSNQS